MSGDGYHHGNLRRAVLDAAVEAIAESGPATWSLRELARRAGRLARRARPSLRRQDRAADGRRRGGLRALRRRPGGRPATTCTTSAWRTSGSRSGTGPTSR
ncbi:hypothetical protein [Actinomadura madurae]|uniref:hypothetical protein n=1 Tax=Actinomadura madurae TaxID=1993 RepID=UPI0020D258F2|nr:hypothetical protein [Actinomadura madurae]MCQ0013913.1 hypothetical protein [Actinomadura madurae]